MLPDQVEVSLAEHHTHPIAGRAECVRLLNNPGSRSEITRRHKADRLRPRDHGHNARGVKARAVFLRSLGPPCNRLMEVVIWRTFTGAHLVSPRPRVFESQCFSESFTTSDIVPPGGIPSNDDRRGPLRPRHIRRRIGTGRAPLVPHADIPIRPVYQFSPPSSEPSRVRPAFPETTWARLRSVTADSHLEHHYNSSLAVADS